MPYGFSNIEMTELGKAIGTMVNEQFPALLSKGMSDKEQQEIIKKMVEENTRAILKKYATRSVPWGVPQLAPVDYVNLQKRLMEPSGYCEVTKRFQDFNDDLYIMTKVLHKPAEQLKIYGGLVKDWGALAKAMDTLTAGEGLEWVPEGFSNQMIEAVELEAVVAKLFAQFAMHNPSKAKASTPTTDRLSFTAVKLITAYPVSDELVEDSIVPVLPMLRKSIAKTIAIGRDEAIINGQPSATIDTGNVPDAEDIRSCWDGLRYMANNGPSGVKQGGSTWSNANGLGLLQDMDEDMDVYGIEPDEVEILLNTKMYNKAKGIDEIRTTDKTGSAATILSGKVTEIDGIHITKSRSIGQNLNGSGIYDGVTTTKLELLKVHQPSFMLGNRKQITIEHTKNVLTQQQHLVATAREHWKAIRDYTTEPIVTWLYNLAK